MSKSIFLITLVICFLALLQLTGCEEETTINESSKSEAPVLPPEGSMYVDLSAFNDGAAMLPTIPAVGMAPAPASGRNYANALTRVAAINTAVVSSLAFPAGLFKHAKEYQPVEQEDGSWVWTYTVKYDIFTANAKLIGKGDIDKNYWTMKVSIDNPVMTIKDFEWYNGICTKDNTSGSWQFFDPYTPTERNPTAKIQWNAQTLARSVELNIENVDTRSEYVGDTLLYKANPEKASMSYKDISANEIWDISWDIKTGAGSIKVPRYNNGERACWDSQKQDIQCN